MAPFTLQPGQEKEYIVEWDLDRDGQAPDWAITAWGENAEVKIRVPVKGESSHFALVD
jgi:hypothetical protein